MTFQTHKAHAVEMHSPEPELWDGKKSICDRYRPEYEFQVVAVSVGGIFTIQRTLAPLSISDDEAIWVNYNAFDPDNNTYSIITPGEVGKFLSIKGGGRVRLVAGTDNATISLYLAKWA